MKATDGWTELPVGTDRLEQGDLLIGVRVVIPKAVPAADSEGVVSFGPEDLVVQTTDIVVLTQTCDLQRNAEDAKRQDPLRVEQVICCLANTVRDSGLGKPKVESALKQNTDHLHGLPPLLSGVTDVRDFWLVYFTDVITVPFTYLVEHARSQKRYRLRNPHREKLSNRFGQLFARPAVDTPNPDFSNYKAAPARVSNRA